MIATLESWRAGLFHRRHFMRNFGAGLVVGVVALPLAMAFAIASGLSPAAGIWAAIIAGFAIAALGGSRDCSHARALRINWAGKTSPPTSSRRSSVPSTFRAALRRCPMSESGRASHITSRRLMIHGRVQGVYYRASAQETALRLNLSGWVRNRRNGTVEALVSGSEAAVEAFIAWAHEGPPAARVDRIDIDDADAPAAGSFEQRPTE